MQDLSELAKDSMWPTAQASSGSRHSSRDAAMTAPGSVPASSDGADQSGPAVAFSGPQVTVGHTGKPDLP
jgi:hypothetical protein